MDASIGLALKKVQIQIKDFQSSEIEELKLACICHHFDNKE